MHRIHRALYVVVASLGTLVLWEAGTRAFDVPAFLVPAPTAILAELRTRPALFAAHAWVTLYETLLGFVLAVAGGVLAAALIVIIPVVRHVVMPALLVAQVVPKVAIAPILLIWFGYGIISKIFIVFLVAFFPIVVNTSSGLVAAEPEMLELARSLEASRWQVFRMIQVPTALPHLFSGMKIAVTLAVIGAVIGEFVGGSRGLGYLIIVSNQELNTPLAFASLFLLSVGGLILYGLIELVERLVIPWSLPADIWKEAGANA